MNKILLLGGSLLVGISLSLAGCGQDEDSNASSGTSAGGMRVIDHSRDEQEFELRRAIGGLERIIESYKEQQFDSSAEEAEKARLEKQLDELLSDE